MSFETDLHNHVITHETLSARIANRFYPLIAPEDTANPCATYQRLSVEHGRTVENGDGMAIISLEIDAWASTYRQARELAEAFRDALDGYSGTMGGTEVGSFWLMEESDDLVETPGEEMRRVFGSRMVYEVTIQESFPAH